MEQTRTPAPTSAAQLENSRVTRKHAIASAVIGCLIFAATAASSSSDFRSISLVAVVVPLIAHPVVAVWLAITQRDIPGRPGAHISGYLLGFIVGIGAFFATCAFAL